MNIRDEIDAMDVEEGVQNTPDATTAIAAEETTDHVADFEARLLEMREDTIDWYRQLEGADACVGTYVLRHATHPTYEDPVLVLRTVRAKMEQFLAPRMVYFFTGAKVCEVAQRAVEYGIQSGFLVHELYAQRMRSPDDFSQDKAKSGPHSDKQGHPMGDRVTFGMSCFAPTPYLDEHTGLVLHFSARVRSKMWPHVSDRDCECDLSGKDLHSVSWIWGAEHDKIIGRKGTYKFGARSFLSEYRNGPKYWPFTIVTVGRMCIVSMQRRVGSQAFVGHAIVSCSEMSMIMDGYGDTLKNPAEDISALHFIGYLAGVLRERAFVVITSWLERTTFLALAHYLSVHAEDMN
jgi:hypothetical protein